MTLPILSTKLDLYVSTDLVCWQAGEHDDFGAAITICGIPFHRLDPGVYAWIYNRMGLAKRAHQSGKIKPAAWNTLRERFNAIHAWAIERLGEATEPGPTNVALPEPETLQPHPPRDDPGAREFTHRVSPEAVAQVMAIRERAMSLGWSDQRLLGNTGRFGFPHGDDYGLVCFVENDTRLGEISRQSIELIQPAGHALRFYNPDVEQPWFKPRPNCELQLTHGERP